MSRQHGIAIVGGGVIGLTMAYYLRKAGEDVTVFDASGFGMACSHGNGGWICPVHAAPIAAPGVVGYTLKSLGKPKSPIYIRPPLELGFYTWAWRFWRRCNQNSWRHGIDALAALNQRTFALVDELAEDGVPFEMYRGGNLHVCRSTDEAATSLGSFAPMRQYGYQVPEGILPGDALREMEPVLSKTVTAGFLLPEERHVNPVSLCNGLVRKLKELGVELHSGTEVEGFDVSARRITAVRTTAGNWPVKSIVLAPGAQLRQLAKHLGVNIPVRAGKGYSFSVDLPVLPKHALHLSDSKVGCSPMSGHLRVVGTMEFSGDNLRLDRRRIRGLIDAAAPYLDNWPADVTADNVDDAWVGMRPMTPDGLPVIDRIDNYDNLYVSGGHGMLGVALAPASAVALTELITTGQRPDVLNAFSFSRL